MYLITEHPFNYTKLILFLNIIKYQKRVQCDLKYLD